MKKSVMFSCSIIAAIGLPSLALSDDGYGSGADIPYAARAMHLIINEVRTDIPAVIQYCKRGTHCTEAEYNDYKDSMPPLYWNNTLHHSAQFYANFMLYADCESHDQACTLKSSVATDYPSICNGHPDCACSDTLGKCSSVAGHAPGKARLRLFYPTGTVAEQLNISGACEWYRTGNVYYSLIRDIHDNPFKGGAYYAIHQYLVEKPTNAAQTYGGHRCWILGGSLCGAQNDNSVGTGYSNGFYPDNLPANGASVEFMTNCIKQYTSIHSFYDANLQPHPLNSGSHYQVVSNKEHNIIRDGKGTEVGTMSFLNNNRGSTYPMVDALYFKTHYYADVPAKTVYVSINGQCTELSLNVGKKTHGVYGTDQIPAPEECTPYFFEAMDENGTISRFPEKGSLIFTQDITDGTCKKSWQAAAEGSCFTTEVNCTDSQHLNAAGTGCEDNTPTACGSYDNDCTKLAGWRQGTCDSGTCHVTACESDYYLDGTTCKGNDLSNCGSKGNKCSETITGWASGTCTDGKCKVQTCTSGLKVENNACVDAQVTCNDDEHVYAKSCEKDDELNCGAHERKCEDEISNWAEGTCENHQCIVTKCQEDKVISDNQCIDKVNPEDPSGDNNGNSGDNNGNSGDNNGNSGDNNGNSGNNNGNSGNNNGNSGNDNGNSGNNDGNSGDNTHPSEHQTGNSDDDYVFAPTSDSCSGTPLSHQNSIPWMIMFGLSGLVLMRRRKSI